MLEPVTAKEYAFTASTGVSNELLDCLLKLEGCFVERDGVSLLLECSSFSSASLSFVFFFTDLSERKPRHFHTLDNIRFY